jgi:phosphoglucosamine mutase
LPPPGSTSCCAGPLPTPGGSLPDARLRLQAGVVISASHNPFDDNGIKFFSAGAPSCPTRWSSKSSRGSTAHGLRSESAKLGKARRIDDAAGRYIEFCKSTFPNELDLRGMKIVVDCAHGAGLHVAPKVFHELGAEVSRHWRRAERPQHQRQGRRHVARGILRRTVMEQGADVGIALDGDGDRMVMVDAAGQVYDGDQLLYVIARQRSWRATALPGVVGTLMSNLGFEHALAQAGHPLRRAKVGDRYVLEDAARARLEAGRRELRPHHLPRSAHHRRRHHRGPAGAGCLAPADPAIRRHQVNQPCWRQPQVAS